MAGKFPTPPLPYPDDKASYTPNDAIPHLLATEEAKQDISAVISFLESFMLMKTVLTNGVPVEILARLAIDTDGSPQDAWTLINTDEEFEYQIQMGKIYLDYGDWGNPAVIENADLTFSAKSKGWVWIELDVSDPGEPKLELKHGDKWEWHPDSYKEEGSPVTVRKAAFPVWEFRSGDELAYPSESVVADGMIGEQFLKSNHSMVVWGVHRFATTDDRNDQTFAPYLAPLA